MVPREALLDMEKRIVKAAGIALEELLANAPSETSAAPVNENDEVFTWFAPAWQNPNGGGMDDSEKLGPGPESLKFITTTATFVNTESATTSRHHDVGYKPKLKEAHGLGLPETLGGILHDIAVKSSRLGGNGGGGLVTAPRSEAVIVNVTEPSPSLQLHQQKPLMSQFASSPERERKSPTRDVVVPLTLKQPSGGLTSSMDFSTEQSLQQQQQTTDRPGLIAAHPTQSVTSDDDPTRSQLLAAIRGSSSLLKSRNEQAITSASGHFLSNPSNMASAAAKSVSLADEMREKLVRRQKALSGEQDEEEQQQARRRRRDNSAAVASALDSSSDSDTASLPSVAKAALKMPRTALEKRKKSGNNDAMASVGGDRGFLAPGGGNGSGGPTAKRGFAGIDALLSREMLKATIAPPKPGSSVGDWEDE